MLSLDEIRRLYKQIKTLEQKLIEKQPNSTEKRLELFEKLFTLSEFKDCFKPLLNQQKPDFDALNQNLSEVLRARWERIRFSRLCYTCKPFDDVNQFCLQIAQAIAPSAQTTADIQALAPGAGPYFILMPTLTYSEDIYNENIHCFKLYEFVLSDDQRIFIPVKKCIEQAAVSDTGRFRHLVGDSYDFLSESEVKRLRNHSVQTQFYFDAVVSHNHSRLHGPEISAKLTQLIASLWAGGVAKGSGSEYKAGTEANIGIALFNDYWQSLDPKKRTKYFKRMPNLEANLKLLFEPYTGLTQGSIYCVQVIASDLNKILEDFNQSASEAHATLQEQKINLEDALVNPNKLKLGIDYNKLPRHILPLTLDLDSAQEQFIFENSLCNNALQYALIYEQDALTEFELDRYTKKAATQYRHVTQGSALVCAARDGRLPIVKLLMDWGADLNAYEEWEVRPLHTAVISGHFDIVQFLLEQGADSQSKDVHGYTALHYAVIHNQSDELTEYLLKHSNLMIRDEYNRNAFDIVLRGHIRYLNLFLKHMLRLPLTEQSECLKYVNNGLYSSVIDYVAREHTDLFAELIIELDTIEDKKHVDTLIRKTKPLFFAARLGESDSVRRLLAYNVDIHAVDELGNNALHCAADNGHNDVVDILIEHGVDVNATGADSNTALHLAIKGGFEQVVDELLISGAVPTLRNADGFNCIDFCYKLNPDFDASNLLINLSCQPLSVQKEALTEIAAPVYDNVLSFVSCTQNKYLDTVSNQIMSAMSCKDNNLAEAFKKFQYAYHCMATHYHNSLEKYKDASVNETADKLLNRCGRAITLLSQSNMDTQAWNEFKMECQNAIGAAKPVLEQHRQWGKLMAKLIVALLMLPISLPLYALGLFSLKTRSEQILDNMDSVFTLREPLATT